MSFSATFRSSCPAGSVARLPVAVALLAGFLACAPTSAQQVLQIDALHGNGVMTWTFPTNNVVRYEMQWASEAGGPWYSFATAGAALANIAPTSTTMAVRVPMFYRLSYVQRYVEGMVLIPEGSFQMGDTLSEGYADERPAHTVNISAFYLDATEVTLSQWTNVHAWATTHGYTFSSATPALGKGNAHPAHSMTWFDAMLWCNARSEKAGLEPCYYTTPALTTVVRSGDFAPSVKWTAKGYRLPTEAEWQKAARGGLPGKRFPWGNTITHAQANYFSSATYAYDISPTRASHPAYDDAPFPYSSPAGSFPANGYGLFDMAGNLTEWLWDWYGGTYYASSPATDPRGPGPTDGYRTYAGGHAGDLAENLRVSFRGLEFPTNRYNSMGFRCAKIP